MPYEEPRYACYNCKEELVFEVKIGRRDMCPNCSAYLHCCYNCRHWDPHVHNQCRENQGEFIRDRAEGNFCLYFDFRPIEEDRRDEAAEARRKLEALFGGPQEEAERAAEEVRLSPEERARRKLEALFKGLGGDDKG